MNKTLLALTLLCGMLPLGRAMAQDYALQASKGGKMNVGVRVGFNSSMFLIDQFTIGDTEVKNVQNNYKVGYFGAFFWRINLKKHHFLLTEVQYNVAKGSISAPELRDEEEMEDAEIMDKWLDVTTNDMLVKSKIHTINVPLLYGYKFIDAAPYGMSFFLGPEISYVWKKYSKSEYSGFSQQNISETVYPLRFNGVLGVAVNVANVFFDFRYRIGLHNMVKSIDFDRTATEAPHNTKDIILKRRNNELSFSVGVIF